MVIKVAVTGHRPQKLGMRTPPWPGTLSYRALVHFAKLVLEPLQDTDEEVLVGMALGWDLACAEACRDLLIPYHAYLVHASHSDRWHSDAKRLLESLLEGAEWTTVVCSEPAWEPSMPFRRNGAMVEAATRLIALWDGSPSGTSNCVRQATRRGLEIENVWPRWVLERPHLEAKYSAPSLMSRSPGSDPTEVGEVPDEDLLGEQSFIFPEH